jgi:hypothetical protein
VKQPLVLSERGLGYGVDDKLKEFKIYDIVG